LQMLAPPLVASHPHVAQKGGSLQIFNFIF